MWDVMIWFLFPAIGLGLINLLWILLFLREEENSVLARRPNLDPSPFFPA
jgi:hypothetical protein